jgi:hypothetical protein
MSRAVAAVLGVLLCAHTAAAGDRSPIPSPAKQSVAIILGEGRQAPGELWESGVIEALAGVPNIQVVERVLIRHVLDELKLQASGLVDPAQAVRLGAMVSAEAMIILEREPQTTPPLAHVRLIDTRTGTSLLDWLAPAAEFEQRKGELAKTLPSALAKAGLPAGQRRYVGMVGIRSEESGRSLDGMTGALTAMLQHDLNGLPEVIVLERKQLQRLVAERNLSGMEIDLRASAILVEGGLRRGPTRANWR